MAEHLEEVEAEVVEVVEPLPVQQVEMEPMVS